MESRDWLVESTSENGISALNLTDCMSLITQLVTPLKDSLWGRMPVHSLWSSTECCCTHDINVVSCNE